MAAEKDLAGFDDCDSSFTEIAVDTNEHVRHSAYWAVSTQRGQDWEQPDRWADIWSLLEESVARVAAGAIQSVSSDLEETDSRILRALYTLIPGELTTWVAEITTRAGTVTVEGPLQPLPQDLPAPVYEPLPPAPASPGGFRTLRQAATTAGLFPYWILGPNSGRVVYSFALALDAGTEFLMQGIQQRFPLLCDAGALPWLGRDLGLRRGRYETELSFRRRLTRWIPTFKRAGVTFAICEQVQAAMFPDVPRVHVVQHDPSVGGPYTRATWSTRDADGTERTTVTGPSSWDVDSNDPNRPASLDARDPRVWVLIEQPSSDTARIFAPRTSTLATPRDLHGMNGAVRDDESTAPDDFYLDFYDLAQQFRSVGTYVAGILLVFGEADPEGAGDISPDGSWHDPLNDAGDGNRIPDIYRLMYLDRYVGARLPADPAPYQV